ncbi:P-loop containing nucleoside triphosphate hydrolase protein [Halteromyces radiatus]|uniref:P-loop containing nucleoside triphosphate hydrolase protein n=1 Tax=Halteromyces radiatus TaxID=101107 RepID=UPI00221F96CD|nr:P-loop containing nucleoside triphosphate hydrolase protein [Halteromyces radiatus]KAI8083089.1 P-loop containing nucleoside triphosphate hydrolase protein [Halteromyces radiatus]
MLSTGRYLRPTYKLLSTDYKRSCIRSSWYHRLHTTRNPTQTAMVTDPLEHFDTPNSRIDSVHDTLFEDTTTTLDPFNSFEELDTSLLSKQQKTSDKHDKILNFSDLRQQIYQDILHPEESKGVQSTDLPALNQILKGHRQGELTIVTGTTGGGKTTVMSQLSLDYCKSGVPTLWGSFEILNQRLAKKMLYQFAEKDLSLYPEELDHWGNEFEKLPLYFLKFFSSTAIDDVLEASQHAVDKHGVQHIILDNLQFMLSQQGRSSLDRWELQDYAVHQLRRFATKQNVHISLVVHPRKDPGEQMDINSVFGSAKVTQEADNVIILQKHGLGGLQYLDVKKNRYDGTTGVIPYKFDRESLKIRSCTEDEVKQASKGLNHRSSQSSVQTVTSNYRSRSFSHSS